MHSSVIMMQFCDPATTQYVMRILLIRISDDSINGIIMTSRKRKLQSAPRKGSITQAAPPSTEKTPATLQALLLLLLITYPNLKLL